MFNSKILLQLWFFIAAIFTNSLEARFLINKRSTDSSIKGYLTERTCWWNEVCKEEFQSNFRCKCPEWSVCRAPGRYYNAFCTITETGYIWFQPSLHGEQK